MPAGMCDFRKLNSVKWRTERLVWAAEPIPHCFPHNNRLATHRRQSAWIRDGRRENEVGNLSSSWFHCSMRFCYSFDVGYIASCLKTFLRELILDTVEHQWFSTFTYMYIIVLVCNFAKRRIERRAPKKTNWCIQFFLITWKSSILAFFSTSSRGGRVDRFCKSISQRVAQPKLCWCRRYFGGSRCEFIAKFVLILM